MTEKRRNALKEKEKQEKKTLDLLEDESDLGLAN